MANGSTSRSLGQLAGWIRDLGPDRPGVLRGVSSHARAWLICELCRRELGPWLWVLPDEAAAEQSLQAARFFLGESERSTTDPFDPRVVPFPLHQGLPYEELSPDRFVVAERLAVLFRLMHGSSPDLLVTSVPALMRKVMPRSAIDSVSTLILRGQEIERGELAEGLVRAGYLNVPLVEDPGTFAIRGGILDLFSPGLPLPVRIELLGDEVESIRSFDPASQRTVARLDSVYLGPVREILQDRHSRELALTAVDRLADQLDLPSSKVLPIKRSLREGIWFFGIESLLPAFHPELESLFDSLPSGTRVLIDDPGAIESSARANWQQAETSYSEARSAGNLVFPPDSQLLSPEQLRLCLEARPRLVVGLTQDHPAQEVRELPTSDVRGLRAEIEQAAATGEPLDPLLDLIKRWRADRIRPLIVASRPSRARELSSLLRSRNIPARIEDQPFDPRWSEQVTPPVRIVPGRLSGGFFSRALGMGFIPDSEVFGRPVRRARSRPGAGQALALKPGDLVVHVDFGIGRFEKLGKLAVEGNEGDFLLLDYRGGDRLYLPVTRMNLIEPYRGPAGSQPALSKLGGKGWDKLKQRVHQALLEMAASLVRVHATRKVRRGSASVLPEPELRSLEASFPFDETEDQQRAISEVFTDIAGPQAMDRLICGDVGFGKTEVAVRAAYLNALNGRQTAILVPTTVLALQHLDTFRARLQHRAVQVEMVSRLVKPARQKEILGELARGQVDVIIGTHRLLMKDVAFKNLGLLVIDEEHRFGVRHKEKLKQIRQDVDVLTMTATPIPRTLQMSLTGLRDISVIQTPPPGRRAIRTLITRFSKRVVQEAIRRELARGGQVFFLHNWVKSLPAMQRFIDRAVPEARTAIAHGQMGERKLEQVMTEFVRRNIDVLICTSIIESGLDIPSANTILINRADHFGLSQLHQIRGRVGRAAERAYAYFLIPGLAAITADARMRLEALSDFSDLGSGYRLAAQDLEMRGSGNLLGKSQSGHIAAVGFELYSRLLERAVMEIKGQSASEGPEPEINLAVAGYLPESYVPDLDQRLDIYSRLSRAESEDEVFELEKEIEDRFGPEPEEVENLCELMALKTKLRRAGVIKLESKAGQLLLQFDVTDAGITDGLVRLAKEQSERVSLDPSGLLKVRMDPSQAVQPLALARGLLRRLVG